MRRATQITLAVWTAIVLACGGPGHRPAATGEPRPGAAEDMYHRCQSIMEQTRCGTSARDSLNRDFGCITGIANGYYAIDSYADRQQYLIQNGCPPPMVGTIAAPGG